MATGYPGYNSLVPKSAGSVGEVLKQNGYNTFWFGKMHNVPDWDVECRVPLICGRPDLALSTFTASLVVTPINGIPPSLKTPPPLSRTLEKPDYILDHDMADQAIKQHSPAACPWHRLSRGSSTTQPAPLTRRTMHPRIGSPNTMDSSIRAGTNMSQRDAGPADQARRCPCRHGTDQAAPPQIPAWDSLDPRPETRLRADDGSLRRRPSYADNQDRKSD